MATSEKKKKMASKILDTPISYKPQPTIYLDDRDLPAIKKWDVGKKYNIEATVEMVHLSKGEYSSEESSKKHYEARFKITSIKSV